MSENKNLKPVIGLAAVCSLAIALGIWVGFSFGQKRPPKLPANAALHSTVLKLTEVLKNVESNYVDETNLDQLSESTISAMLQQLDPHSTYLTAEELVASNVQLKGELEGIGIEFMVLNDTVHVIAPISGGPSEQVGIQAGDKIITVDGQPFAGQGLKLMEMVEKLRGPKGTKVKLGVQRDGEEKLIDYTVTRAKIPIYSIDASYMVNQHVGYIKVSRFAAQTFQEFKTAFNTLKKQGMTKLMLDLRGNPGGYMDMAIQMANMLLPKGQLIVYTKGKKSKYNAKYTAKGEDQFAHCPIVVLINEGSASASEIIAGALQDNDRALIVGRRSFGKGLVQVPIQLQDDSQIRLTVARYYTPSGRFIQKPYEDGSEAYHIDLLERYKQGEFFRVDHIQINEELKFQTNKGRTVYGGGGIMPDYFVPLEPYGDYFKQLLAVGTLRQYALNYVGQHRENLTNMQREGYRKRFEVTDLMLKQVVKQAEKEGIIYDDKAFRTDKRAIKHLLKALIARNIWRDQGFYPIYHEEDQEFQKALQLFDEAEALLQEPPSQE